MNETFLKAISEEFHLEETEVDRLHPLVLAYIGDAVYEVYIRTLLVSSGSFSVHRLHQLSIGYVKAKAQSDIIHTMLESLTPEEQDVVRRGRNAKSGTIPKNADVAEYKYATGFESLVGYLYLKKDFERLMQVLRQAVEAQEKSH